MFKEERDGHLRCLKMARHYPAIHHLLFPDDLLIFSRATFSEVVTIKSCLDEYCKWSSQYINSSKSLIQFSRYTNPSPSLSINNILPFQTNPSKSIYVDISILFGNSKVGAFQDILDKVHKKIDGLRTKTLPQAGRLVLIKIVAAALPVYTMSSFLLPASFCSKLDKIFKDFW